VLLSSLIGVRGSGRSTLLELVAGGRTFGAERTGRFTARAATISPSDPKLERLAAFYSSRKVVTAEFTLVDYEGVGLGESSGREAEWLNAMQRVDVLVAVLPVYLDEGRSDSVQRRLAEVSADLVIADLTTVENRLERLERDLERAPRVERANLVSEQELHGGLKEALEDGVHLRALEWDETRLKAIGSFGFMTMKSMVVVLNTGEDDVAGWEEAREQAAKLWPYPGTGVAAVSAAIEAEAMELPGDERGEILDMLGIDIPAKTRLIEAVMAAAEVFTVYTGSETEARAWSVPGGTTALGFAGIIHTDLAQGFIRAEVIPLDELEEAGSEAEARRRGLIRSEGKDYELKPDDVVTVLFSR